jgi:hypothetical protein
MEQAPSTVSGDMTASTGSETASPAVTTESSASAAPATQATDATPITDSTTGEPPKDRWPVILENQRKAAREEALKEWRDKHGWAESVDRSQLEQMAQWYSRYNGDAGEFVEAILQESLQHPVHSASVRSRLGRMMASLKATQQAPEKIEPGIPVMNDKGEIVARTYTDAQLEQVLQQKLDAALSPFKEDLDTRKTQAEKAREKAALEAKADADIAYVRKRPGFEKHKAEILAAFNANPQFTLRDAYDAVMDTKLPAEAEAKVRSDLQQKANAQTVNPGTPTGSALPKFTSIREAAEYFDKHPAEAEVWANR